MRKLVEEPLTVDNWEEVYNFYTKVMSPFLERIVQRARDRQSNPNNELNRLYAARDEANSVIRAALDDNETGWRKSTVQRLSQWLDKYGGNP